MEQKIIKRRLTTMSDLRRYLGALINELRAGQIDPSLAGKIGFLLNILKGVISDSELERRIEQLEKEVQNERNGEKNFEN